MWKKLILSLVVLLISDKFAQAVPVTIQISGNITFIGGYNAPSTIQAGDMFLGTYTYDTSTIDSGGGTYRHDAPYGFNVTLGGFDFKTSLNHMGGFMITLRDDAVGSGGNVFDSYSVRSDDIAPLANGVEVLSIFFGLSDSTHKALSSNALPLSAPVLSDWGRNSFQIYGPGNSLSILGNVAQAVLIPEPTTLVLLTVGCFLLRRKTNRTF